MGRKKVPRSVGPYWTSTLSHSAAKLILADRGLLANRGLRVLPPCDDGLPTGDPRFFPPPSTLLA